MKGFVDLKNPFVSSLDESPFFSSLLGTGPATGAGPVSPWGLPGPPALVTVNIEADGSSVAVSWAAPDSDGGTPITGFSVVLIPAVLTGTALALVLEMSATQILVPDLLAPGDAYSVTVSAIAAAGTGPAAGGISISRPPELAPSSPITTPGPTATATTTDAVVFGPTPVPTIDPDEPGSILITISEDDGNVLEAAIEAITGGDIEVDDIVITAESTADGISISVPVNGLTRDVELTGRLDVQIGRFSLDVVNGTGTAEIRLADDITVIGVANVSAGENTLDVQITDPVLLYSPHAVDDGSFATSANSLDDVAVSFEVDLELLPDDVSLVTTYSADPDELETAVGSTFALAADSELAYFVSVQKSGVTQGDLGDNRVTMSVSLGWLDDMVSQGLEVAITKISEGGEVFTEVAQCERLSDQAMCIVKFTGAAGGFSVFAIYGFVNPDPGPRPQPLAVSGSDTTPGSTATPAPAAGAVPSVTATIVAEAAQGRTPTPEIAPAPTGAGLDREDAGGFGDAGGGGGPSVLVIVAIAAVAVVVGGSVIAVFVRRPEVPTAGLAIIAVAVGSVGLIASDSSVAQADGQPDVPDTDIQQLDASHVPDFDKNDFRYRKVGSSIRALNEAQATGNLIKWHEYVGQDVTDPSIDVTIWFDLPESVNLELIEQTAVVLNHVRDVVEVRVPIRFAHQLSYMPGVLRVDQIVPPQAHVTSEGTTVHGSPAWNTVRLDGTGIKVRIIDIGFEGWTAISPSELPNAFRSSLLHQCWSVHQQSVGL